MKTKNSRLLTGIAITILLVLSCQVSAQKIELSPFIGYETGAYIHSTYGNLHIGDGMDWGGSIDVGVGRGRYGEFSYSHMATTVGLEGGVSPLAPVNLAVDYYSLGILQEV